MCLAIPGRVEEITNEGGLRVGRVNFGGVVKRVCLDYVPEVEVGDYTDCPRGVCPLENRRGDRREDAGRLSRDGRAGRRTGRRGRAVCAGCEGAAVELSGWKLHWAVDEKSTSELRSSFPSCLRIETWGTQIRAGRSSKMKYLTEFRNGEIAQRMAREIAQITTRPWKIMEVCGGQTHSIIRNGIDQMLPAGKSR